MRILALDPSYTAIGYCVLNVEDDEVISCGVFNPDGLDMDSQLSSAYHWLQAKLTRLPPMDFICIEMPVLSTSKYRKDGVLKSKANPKITIKLSQMVGVLRLAAWAFPGRTITVLPQDRLTALGLPRNLKRDPAKQQVMGRVNARYGLSITCDDESDAIAVALAGVKELRKQKRKEKK